MIFECYCYCFEFNNDYREMLAEAGLVASGVNPDLDLVEIVEYPANRFHVGVQFHPEFKSSPLDPHPIFRGFVEAAKRSRTHGASADGTTSPLATVR